MNEFSKEFFKETQGHERRQSCRNITSLLSILFLTFHLADDIVRGFENAGQERRPFRLNAFREGQEPAR